MERRLASPLLVFGVLVLATLVAARPWAWDPRWGFGQRDAGFALVSVDWLQTALLHLQSPWRTPLGWPLPDATTLVDWMAGQALLGLPWRLLGGTPWGLHTFSALTGLLLTAWACQYAARIWTGPGPHTWVAGVIGGLGTSPMSHAQHLNLLHHELPVLGAALVGVGLHAGRVVPAALGGALLVGSAHFGAYTGMHAALFAGALALAAGIAPKPPVRVWGALVGGALLAGLTVLPVAVRYADAAARDRVAVTPVEIAAESWDPSTSLRPLPGAPLHAWLPAPGPSPVVPPPRLGAAPAHVPASTHMDPPNPGYLALGLGLVGLAVLRRGPGDGGPRGLAWAPAFVGIGALLLALGPQVRWDGVDTGIPGPAALVDALLGGARLRAPARWLGVAWIALGLLASLGLARLGRGRSPVARLALGLVAVVVALGEVPPAAALPAPAAALPAPSVGLEPVSHVLDQVEEEGALFETDGHACGLDEAHPYRLALFHGRPMVGGTYARGLRSLQEMNRVLRGWPSPEAVVLLRAVGTRVTWEHPPLQPLPADFPGVCLEAEGHRRCVLDPLPVPQALEPAPPAREVVVLRWPDADRAPRTAVVSCGEAQQVVRPRAWVLPTRLHRGWSVEGVEVVLDPPCPQPPLVDEGAPMPLSAAGAAIWPPPPPPRPRRVADAGVERR